MGLAPPPPPPLLVSQIRTVVSNPPETTRESSAPAIATQLTRPTWPSVAWEKRRRVCAVATSQRKTVRSPPDEAKRALSEETARERISWEWAW